MDAEDVICGVPASQILFTAFLMRLFVFSKELVISGYSCNWALITLVEIGAWLVDYYLRCCSWNITIACT